MPKKDKNAEVFKEENRMNFRSHISTKWLLQRPQCHVDGEGNLPRLLKLDIEVK